MRIAVVLGLTLALLIPTTARGDTASGSRRANVTAEARAVTLELFRTLNERRYDRTCALLASRGADRELCALGLRIGFMWSQEVDLRITRVKVRPDGAVVSALAGGARGTIVLTRERGRLRVLRLEGV